jgi:hypothetical protein
VDLVDEQDLVPLQVGEHRREIARLLDDRPGGGAHRHAHLIADHVSQRRLAESRRAVQEYVIERFIAAARRGDRHMEIVADAILADVFVERARAQPRLVLRVLGGGRRHHQARIGRHRISSRSADRSACSNDGSGVAFNVDSTAFSAAGR